MKLISFIVLVFLVTTGFGRNIDDFWDKQQELEMNRNVRSQEGKCGIRPFDNRKRQDLNEKRIVNGEFASYGEFPWHVNLDGMINKTRFRNCGASIINEFWLVTAAHCVQYQPSDYIVTAGNHDWTNEDKNEQWFSVEKIVKHDKYIDNDIDPDYDIALFKIRSVSGRGIKFNDYVQPVCLPDSTIKEGTKCLTSGWGETREDMFYDYYTPGQLKKAELTIVSKQTCQQWFKKSTVTDRMLCASGDVIACKGDSGGGLVYKSKGAYTLVGAASWGFDGCHTANVFAHVYDLLPWIQSNLQLYSGSLEESELPRRP